MIGFWGGAVGGGESELWVCRGKVLESPNPMWVTLVGAAVSVVAGGAAVGAGIRGRGCPGKKAGGSISD